MRAPGLIGPLAAWELRRLSRRGQILRAWLSLLCGFAFVAVAFAVWRFHPLPLRDAIAHPLPAHLATDFARSFALVLLEAQLAAVVAITPALAASAVAEEKDRHTLPLLLTTQLTDREIVFGKAAARVVFVLVAATAVVPLLALALRLGGVDWGFLAAGAALVLGTALLCAAIGLSAACRAPDFRSAQLRAYGRTALLVCGAFVPPLLFVTPFGVLWFVHNRPADVWTPAAGVGYALAQAGLAGIILAGAARALRLREPTAGPLPPSEFPPPPRPADPPLLQPRHAAPPALPPLDATNPVLWKERCAGWRPSWAVPSVARALSALASALALCLFLAGAWVVLSRVAKALDPKEAQRLADRTGAPDAGGNLLLAAGVFAAGRYLLPLAAGLSGAIAGERRRCTLDALLSTPLDRRMILRAKVQAHAEGGGAFFGVAVAAVGMAFTADAGIRIGAAAALLMLCSAGLVVGAGAWLTVRCATDVRAFRLLLLFAVVAAGWPAVAWNLLSPDVGVPREWMVNGILTASAACAVAGALLWWLAERRLERGE